MRDRSIEIRARIRECWRYAGSNRRALREIGGRAAAPRWSDPYMRQWHLRYARKYERHARRWQRVLRFHLAALAERGRLDA